MKFPRRAMRLAALLSLLPFCGRAGHSLLFNGGTDGGHVKIAIEPHRPLDVGGNFTIEFWLKALPGDNTGAAATGADGWKPGNVLFDRDVSGAGDHGEHGVSLGNGRVAFGASNGASGQTILGGTAVDDGAWHHVALTRRAADGQLRIFIDGQIDAEGTGPAGDLSYRDGRATAFPQTDPFLFIGAGKQAGGLGFRGWLDEVRVSSVVRYAGPFSRPRLPFRPDPDTAGLYHLDAGTGGKIFDASTAAPGPAHGELVSRGSPAGPVWSTDKPFDFGPPAITLQSIATGLGRPVAITHAGDASGRLFITLQTGKILIHDGAALLPTPFLDIGSIVKFSTSSGNNEEGLLSVAFDPGYKTNGHFYVFYNNLSGDLAIASYSVSANPNVANTNGAVLLIIPHPINSNHNGGQLQFGPDGFLYAGTGDGGSANDPLNNAQNLGSRLGKVLRLAVNGPAAYTNPPGNPFANDGNAGTLAEIWSYGLRNPWRFSFDRLTGDLFIADVGQGALEEVNFQPAGSAGGANYGWKVMEGTNCFSAVAGNPPCLDPGLTPPILVYGRALGQSITGGYRYRGRSIPPLTARYLYADFVSGNIWSAAASNGVWNTSILLASGRAVSTFGEDEAGELYLAHRPSNDLNGGIIFRVAPADSDSDGLPDWWERIYFGHATNALAGADTDGDGATNLEEFRAGTDPLEKLSVLRILKSRDSGGNVFLRFPSVHGKRYCVDFRTSLQSGSNGWTILKDNLEGTGGQLEVTEPSGSSQQERYYRVKTVK